MSRIAPILATAALALAAATTANAQTLASTGTIRPLRVSDVKTASVRVGLHAEGNRLHRLAGLDEQRVAAALERELAAAGITATSGSDPDAVVQLQFICAGHDEGRMGCHVQLRLFAPVLTDAGVEPGYTFWDSGRQLYARTSWADLGRDADAIVAQLAARLRDPQPVQTASAER